MSEDLTVRDNPSHHRYELVLHGSVVGFADYRREGDVIVLPHTVTDPAHRGRGFAAVLVRHVLDDVRARGLAIDPQCWYVAEFVRAHPEYSSLRAQPGREPDAS